MVVGAELRLRTFLWLGRDQADGSFHGKKSSEGLGVFHESPIHDSGDQRLPLRNCPFLVAFTNGDLLIEGMVKQDAEIATALWTTPKVSALTRFEARLRGWLTSDDIRRDNSRAADVVRPLRSFIKKVPLQKNVIDNNDRVLRRSSFCRRRRNRAGS
jgi:hypothetical protein